MARSGHCKTCGARIRPSAKDMSVAAASRIHYWKHHREVMLGGQKRGAKAKKKPRR
jgi:hypothetical protein